jgi:hypothetical protein
MQNFSACSEFWQVSAWGSCGESLSLGIFERLRRATPIRLLIETRGRPRFGATLIARVVRCVFASGQDNAVMIPESLRGAQMVSKRYADTTQAQAIMARLRDKDETNQNWTSAYWTLTVIFSDMIGVGLCSS